MKRFNSSSNRKIEEDVFWNSLICNVGEDCYRPPMRKLPENILCDLNIIFKENSTEDSLDENVVNSSSKEFWWRKAILVAKNLEKIHRKIDFSKEENERWDEDNDCWIDADNTDKEFE
ncbi:hypothetical protein Tco_0863063 [Tanacetum coccineum]